MRLNYLLPALSLSLPALWALGFTVEVLRDNRIPGDMTIGAIMAVLLLMVVAASLLILLVWPLSRAMSEESRGAGEPLTNGR